MNIKTMTIAAALAALAATSAANAAAGDISVATFLAKAEALQKKGAMALFSSDIKLLQSEGKAAGAAYRARLERERASGTPSSCPPKNTKINSNQLLAHLRTYPAAERTRTTLRTALADMFIKTYPCR